MTNTAYAEITSIDLEPGVFTGIHDLIEQITDSIGSDAYFSRVEPIEYRSVPGFIPYTEGGLNGIVTFGFYQEYALSCKIIEPFVIRDYEEQRVEFRRQHELTDDADVYDHPEWEDFQTEWEQSDEGSEWFVYVRAILFGTDNSRNETGEDEVCFIAMVNDDFGYGRDSIGYAPGGSHDFYERTVKLSEVTADLLSEIQGEMLKAWAIA